MSYHDLFDLFLQNHRPLMFRAFVSTASPFDCERCQESFAPDGEAVDMDDPVLCERCAKKQSRR
jgi:formylmethanofuran dehydrogenase subunit E